MTTTHYDERERLEHEANLVRGKLAMTLDVLDGRAHDLVDVKLQVRRHLVPIVIVAGVAALALVSGIGYALYRFSTREERKRHQRRALAARVWNHPERLVQPPKPPVLVEIGRKLLVSTVTLLGMSLIRRAINGPARLPRPSPAMPALDVHHTGLGEGS